ncbi:MAG: PP2C family protein-serine/threonine phosphatase [Phycisphaerales bacterium]
MDQAEAGNEPRNGSQSAWVRVLGVMERLALSRDLTEVLGLINDAMRDGLEAERASVFRYDRVRDELFSAQAHGVGEELRFAASSGLAGEAAQTRRIINVKDCYSDGRFNPEIDRRTGYRTRTMLTVPLASLDGTLEGVVQVLNKRGPTGHFTQEDELIARALASQAAVAIRRAALLESERQRAKLEADLRVAREIQRATLPTELPRVPGYSVAAWLSPAEETAGDSYDVITRPGDGGGSGSGVWLFVADAAGHGVGPALAAAQAQAMFRMGVRAGLELEEMLEHLNSGLRERLPIGMFVCAFVGVLDTRRGAIRYAAAGMSPIVRLRAGADGRGHAALSEATLAPLGVDEEIGEGATAEIVLDAGDGLVVATDGVYEFPSDTGRPQGTGAAVAAMESAWSQSGAAALLRDIAARVCGGIEDGGGGRSAPDDRAILVVARDAR